MTHDHTLPPEPPAEAEFQELSALLDAWQAPTLNATSTPHLIQALRPLVPVAPAPRRATLRWSINILRSQLRVVQKEIWLASLVVIGLGLFVTLALFTPKADLLPLAIFAPIITAISIALLYNEDDALIRELENSTQTSFTVLLLARLLLVFGFNLALSLAASFTLTLIHTEITLWPLVQSWLLPMLLLSSLAFFITVQAQGDTSLGLLLSLALWGSHLLLQTLPNVPLLAQLRVILALLPNLNTPLATLTLSLALFASALWQTQSATYPSEAS